MSDDKDDKESSGSTGRADEAPREEAAKGAGAAEPAGEVAKVAGAALARAAVKTAAEEVDSFRSNVRTIAGAFLVAIFIRVVVFEAFEIEGPSMEPTFVNGDRVIVAKYPFGLFLPFMNEAVTSWGMPEPGDVVIVRSPADNVDIVKRVIGVPGDRIEIRDDVVYRNGEPIRTRELGPCREEESSEDPGVCVWYEERIGDRTYRTSTSLIEPTESLSEREVPPGHVFVLGDHRDRSNDSRNPAVGMIPIGRVKGRADSIYWSSDEEIRWSRFFTSVE
ncbi:MAG: signal peptidase I [Sandaracinaceae bacterium]